MSRKMSSSRLLQAAGASSYYHGSNNINGGGDQAGGGFSTQQALSDISSSRSQGSLSLGCVVDHEFQKPLLLLDNADINSDKTTADDHIIIVDNTNNSNNLICHRSINHGDITFRADSLINFKNGSTGSGSFMNGKGSLLSFDRNHQIQINQHKDDDNDDDSFIWKDDDDNIMSCYVDNNSREVIPTSDPKGSYSSSRTLDQANNYNYQPGSSSCGWLYSDSTVIAADRVQESGLPERALSKRPYMGDRSSQPSKKQCTTVAKSSSYKPNKTASSKDPQSIAAKNRRERISERLKILQELVPNGPKVDLVTMLDKAISYVKFLQLQVKVLATDEFWPAQGGKAPDIAQVKEAIDAILASQRESSSSSK